MKESKSFGPVLNLDYHAPLGIAAAEAMSGNIENISETIINYYRGIGRKKHLVQ